MSLPSTTTAGNKTTGKKSQWAGPDGWYFIQYLDGSVALVYLKNHIWQWSKGGAPPANAGDPTPYFLGTASHITGTQDGRAKLAGLLQHNANPHQASIIMAAIDSGVGKSAWIPQTGKARGFTPGNDAAPVSNPYDSVANAIGGLANKISSPFSFLDFLGSASFWAGLGMALAGAGLVAFGVFQLAGVGKTTAIRVLK